MWQRKDEIDAFGIRVCVVTFDTGALASNYADQAEWNWPILIDQERALYHAYSMGRGNWWSIYGPASVWNYIKLMWEGRMPGKPGADFRQFGGDVLIDPQGMVRLHFTSKSPHDRPTVQSLLNVVGMTT